MKCSKCGHELPEGASFCESCGMIIGPSENPIDSSSNSNNDVKSNEEFDAIIAESLSEETETKQDAPLKEEAPTEGMVFDDVSSTDGTEEEYEEPLAEEKVKEEIETEDPAEEVSEETTEVEEISEEDADEGIDMLIENKGNSRKTIIISIVIVIIIALSAGAVKFYRGDVELPNIKLPWFNQSEKTTASDVDDTSDDEDTTDTEKVTDGTSADDTTDDTTEDTTESTTESTTEKAEETSKEVTTEQKTTKPTSEKTTVSTTKAEPSKEDTTKPVTTEVKEAEYKKVDQTVYAKSSLNVRSEASTDSKVITTLKKGEAIKRVAIGDNGWSKVIYNGKTYYVYSRYVSTEKITETTAATTAHTTKPQTTKPQATKPQTTKPQTTKPQTTKPQTTKPQTTKPQTTKPTTKPEPTTNPDQKIEFWPRKGLIKELNLPAIEKTVKEPTKYLSSSYVVYVTEKRGLNIRIDSKQDSASNSLLRYGRAIQVLAKDGDWLFGYTEYYGRYGWFKAEYTSKDRPTTNQTIKLSGVQSPDKKYSEIEKKTVAVNGLYLRYKPSADAAWVETMEKGLIVEVLGVMNDNSEWIYVRDTMTGYTGWIRVIHVK